MKIIDLLNKIANEEDVPKKIKFDDEEFAFTGYNSASKNYTNGLEDLFEILDGSILNDEIEIIEEEKKIPENNFNYIYSCEDEHIMANFENIKTTLKDIIDYLQSKGE